MMRGARWTLTTALWLGAVPAHADVTAADVWASMKAQGAQAGSVTEAADGLTLTDVTVTPATPTAIGFQTAAAERVILRNIDGGRVELRPEGRIIWRATATGKLGDRVETLETVVTINGPGARTVISGTPDRMLGASEIPQAIIDATTTAPASASPVVTVHAEASGLAMTGIPLSDPQGAAEMSMSAKALAVTFDDTRDAKPGNGKVALEDLSMRGTFDVPGQDAAAPFLGADVLYRMAFGHLVVDMTLPQTRAQVEFGEKPGALHGEVRDFSLEADANAKAVAATGDIPETKGTGGIKVGRYSYAFSDGSSDMGQATGSGDGLQLSAEVGVPGLPKDAGLGAALAAGLSVQLRGSGVASNQSLTFGNGKDAGGVVSQDAGGDLEFSMSRAGLIASVGNKDARVTATSPQFPGEIGLSLSMMALRVAGPVSPGADAQPWALALRLTDLGLTDAVWDMFDPGRKIPRDPANLVTEVSGTVHVIRDPFADNVSPDVPFRPDTLDLTQLSLSLGGAALQGSGALSFAGKAGQPVPEGKLHFTLKGAYGLLENLGSVEMVPSGALLAMRGGLGLVTRAVGKDDLVSDVEFRADGSIWANGTRMPLP